LGVFLDPGRAASDGQSLGLLAASSALFAMVSQVGATPREATLALVLLDASAACGAALAAVAASVLPLHAGIDIEWVLLIGAFACAAARCRGSLAAGLGSQFYIGQLVACNEHLQAADLGRIALSGVIALVATVAVRRVIAPNQCDAPSPRPAPARGALGMPGWLCLGLQAAVPSAVVMLLGTHLKLVEPVWAITACVYVVSTSRSASLERIRRRLAGTAVGVPFGLLVVPMAIAHPALAWTCAAAAISIYAMALPERYDIACGAFAFALVITMAACGMDSFTQLSARLWETALGAVLASCAAVLLPPRETLAR
ncbi:FUSC family protein, partial [Variovorax sp. KK3]